MLVIQFCSLYPQLYEINDDPKRKEFLDDLFSYMQKKVMSPRKYKCLMIAEKKKLIEKVEGGEKKSDVAKEFKIPLSTLSTIIRHKEKIDAARAAGVRKEPVKVNFLVWKKAW
ncbi:hypothetical protein WA026_015123 [Henosepilachna vigintioctopunctata]|uniref:HTH psq-type domain-containing protein n=1 Tax=Henosepilachna vigintioctopunctata TaxID=420089 RepID=A0AAW1TTD2_9CUCU